MTNPDDRHGSVVPPADLVVLDLKLATLKADELELIQSADWYCVPECSWIFVPGPQISWLTHTPPSEVGIDVSSAQIEKVTSIHKLHMLAEVLNRDECQALEKKVKGQEKWIAALGAFLLLWILAAAAAPVYSFSILLSQTSELVLLTAIFSIGLGVVGVSLDLPKEMTNWISFGVPFVSGSAAASIAFHLVWWKAALGTLALVLVVGILLVGVKRALRTE